MERNARTSLQGVVISTKMAKTIVVEVETHKRHAKYLKRVKYSNRYYAHDEKEIAHEGDVVTIMGCRPLSATKRFRLVSVDKKAQVSLKVAEAEAKLELEAEAKAEKAPEVKVEEKVETPVVETPVVEEKAPAKKPAAKKTTSTTKAPAKKAPAKKAAKAE